MYLSSLLAATGVLTSVVLAAPTQQQVLGLDLDQLPLSHPDFDLDLDARRLVQFGENEEPVWVTELEKASVPSSLVDGVLSLLTRHPADSSQGGRSQVL